MAKQTNDGVYQLVKLIFTFAAPPYMLWRSYVDYAPERFWWWVTAFTGVMLSFKVACEIQAEHEQRVNIENSAYKHATSCVDGLMYLDF